MTKIDKIKTETYVAYSHPEVNDKINELIDAVNELYDLARCAESSLAQKSEQIKALQKERIEQSEEINEMLDKHYSEDLLVPDEVEFYEYVAGILSLKFGNNQILYYDDDTWFVDALGDNRIESKCKLVPCKLEDIEVGDWVLGHHGARDEIEGYELVTEVKKDGYKGMIIRGKCIVDTKIEAMSYDPLKVVPIE